MNPRTIFSCLIAFLIAVTVSAQSDSTTNDILTTKKFRIGVYRNASDLRTNQPVPADGYYIELDTIGGYDRYRLYRAKRKTVTTPYGFCDGHEIYINAMVYCGQPYYIKLLMLGPISYFEDVKGRKNAERAIRLGYGRMFGIIGALAALSAEVKDPKNPGWLIYLSDEDGQPYLFDYKNVSDIFKGAKSPLYQRLKADPRKTELETLRRFVDEFNKPS